LACCAWIRGRSAQETLVALAEAFGGLDTTGLGPRLVFAGEPAELVAA
jgi:hypothetical protein